MAHWGLVVQFGDRGSAAEKRTCDTICSEQSGYITDGQQAGAAAYPQNGSSLKVVPSIALIQPGLGRTV
jgi:hypothetical protein